MMDTLNELFPTPVLKSQYPDSYEEELKFIKNLDYGGSTATDDNKNIIQHVRQSKDTFILDRPELSKIRKFFEEKINLFVKEILCSNDELVITQSWVNRANKGESHPHHKHFNSFVSGVWYPVVSERVPPIQFISYESRDIRLTTESYNHYNCDNFFLNVDVGSLILFPSNIPHSVPANRSNEERISLSFNTWVKGSFGHMGLFDYVPLEKIQ